MAAQPFIQIGRRRIGPGQPVYVIAEMSANHLQKFDKAVEIVRAARRAGADAIKLQTYTPDTLTLRSDREPFRITGGTLWDGRTLHQLYSDAYMPWEWHRPLLEVAGEVGIDLFSTAFDPTAVDFLEDLGVPVHKVASFENGDIPLIERMARTGKPMIISTGMASLEEIQAAVRAARAAGAPQVALLKCTSAYPAPANEMHLRTIPHMQDTFQAPIGLSDHTLGIAVPAAAVALGACIVEKHLILDHADGGPDAAFSLDPAEFRQMVDAIRTVTEALGEVHYGVSERDARSRVFRRSLFVVRDIKAGERFDESNVRSIRPAGGLPPVELPNVVGRRASRDIPAGLPLDWTMVDGK